MFSTLVQVALGGAIGASARFLTGVAVLRITGPGFPLGVMVANILGSFVMGAFVVWAANRSMTHLAPFVVTGVLGGYTTFSAFSLETITMIERGQAGSAALYMILSVGGALGAIMLGMMTAREILA
ncbi:fluoride efflux transporter CrcB [Oceaniovalibus sp. ACAM 378]|uniref:fluoride efflux transporter CrcB n=1 Tax=Oceaniovalibus sp. ACAM 378 TaxID=2599923 RepID=UPI0011D7411D|nr:fluoride efflux transporter CrcB [Oceaniovalibus sp. ACAM 378]TYB88493.1 fluoride efflux transporter CrcB [Oceaniovalibus sp. ACAM 378]